MVPTMAPAHHGSFGDDQTFANLIPSVQGFLHMLADAGSSTGVIDHGLCRSIAMQSPCCALFRDVAFWPGTNYQSIAKRAGKHVRDGAVLPFEYLWMLLGS